MLIMATGDLKTELNTAELQSEFHEALRGLLRASAEIDPFAIYPIKRLEEESGLHMAKRMLATRGQQTGLMRLWQEGRLDISVEALVLQEPFSNLFSQEELDTARQRLIALGYPVD